MKVLLTAINAKYIHSNLAVYNLQACAGEYRNEVELAEYTINEYSEDILRDICRKKPDVLAVSCYIWNIRMVREILADFHQIYPQVPVWVGGPEVSYECDAFLADNPSVHGIMVGEGEETFTELLDCLHGNRQMDQVKGLVYRSGQEEYVHTGMRRLMPLDSIPFIYDQLERFEHKILYYESSRGCPFSCSYCLSSIDKKVRFRSMELVRKELQFFLSHEVAQVKFVDRTFNCDRQRAREIWTYLTEHDNGVTNFHFEVGADLLSEEDFELFARMRPGLIQLEIGVQSVNERTIVEIHRTMELAQLRTAVAAVNAGENIHQHLDLIAGLPYEDFTSFRHSFAQVYQMQPDQLQLGFLKVLKGSLMYEKADEYGIAYTKEAPYEVLYTRWLSYEEVTRLKAVEEMVEVYYNSGQFHHTLCALMTEYGNPFDFYEELAQYYEVNGQNRMSHSRLARFDILLQFLTLHMPSRLVELREWLTYDLYARENVKSRPQWAADLSVYKDQMMKFYKQEEQSRQWLPHYEGYQFKQLGKMTHLEVFSVIGSGENFYLFDYKKRNPKNYEADVLIVPQPDRQKKCQKTGEKNG